MLCNVVVESCALLRRLYRGIGVIYDGYSIVRYREEVVQVVYVDDDLLSEDAFVWVMLAQNNNSDESVVLFSPTIFLGITVSSDYRQAPTRKESGCVE